MINYKLRLFTPCRSYGAEEMTPKSQLCTCSFQDSLRQKNWTLEQIRKFPDTIGYVWKAENDSNTLRVDAKIFASAKKYLRKKKFPDTCGHGLKSDGIYVVSANVWSRCLAVTGILRRPKNVEPITERLFNYTAYLPASKSIVLTKL